MMGFPMGGAALKAQHRHGLLGHSHIRRMTIELILRLSEHKEGILWKIKGGSNRDLDIKISIFETDIRFIFILMFDYIHNVQHCLFFTV
ncbi:hypothetical protein [Novosphingobium sp.]|uniref:hypothetical protein n=1 Tax=Novosphingobium sp. TaxID=1874826 RepID=UPI0031DB5D8F